MEVKDVIIELTDPDKPLVNTHLADLAQMTSDDLALFNQSFQKIDPSRRRQIISRLTELTHDNVELNFDLIFKNGLNDPDPQVKKQSIEGLWENEDPGLIKAFIKMLQNDPSEEVQAAAALGLSKFTLMLELEEISGEYRDTLSQTLLEIFDDKSKSVDVRRRALESAAPLSMPSVKEAIRKAYDDRDERLIIGAIYSMGKTCDNIWLPILYKELRNPDAEIRYEAAGACGEIGEEDAVPHLLEIINDRDVEVRLAVIQALCEIGGREAKQGLQRIANDPNPAIRDAVTQAQSQIQAMEDLTLFEMKPPRGQNDSGKEN